MKSIIPWLAPVLLAPLIALHAAEQAEPDFASLSPEQVWQYELDVMRRIADLALIPSGALHRGRHPGKLVGAQWVPALATLRAHGECSAPNGAAQAGYPVTGAVDSFRHRF